MKRTIEIDEELYMRLVVYMCQKLDEVDKAIDDNLEQWELAEKEEDKSILSAALHHNVKIKSRVAKDKGLLMDAWRDAVKKGENI